MSNNITENIRDYLDTFNDDKDMRLDKIDDLLHMLNFERRLTALTDEESQHMMAAGSGELSDQQRRILNAFDTETQREHFVESIARSQYFRQCAWADYLNGITENKPFDSKLQAQITWDILSEQ